ncbi:unnamed protein product, partial [Ceratitis capitata]
QKPNSKRNRTHIHTTYTQQQTWHSLTNQAVNQHQPPTLPSTPPAVVRSSKRRQRLECVRPSNVPYATYRLATNCK